MQRIVFRADTRTPEVLFKEGFKPRFKGGVKIHEGGQMTGGVSTSKDLGVAMRYAAAYDGWVYVAWLAKGVDVYMELDKKGNQAAKGNAVSQMEIAAEQIPGTEIIAARHCRQSGDSAEMYGESVTNAACTVDKKEKDLGLAFLASNVTVPKEYAKK